MGESSAFARNICTILVTSAGPRGASGGFDPFVAHMHPMRRPLIDRILPLIDGGGGGTVSFSDESSGNDVKVNSIGKEWIQ